MVEIKTMGGGGSKGCVRGLGGVGGDGLYRDLD